MRSVDKTLFLSKDKAICLVQKLVAIIRPNYRNTKGHIFYSCISNLRSKISKLILYILGIIYILKYMYILAFKCYLRSKIPKLKLYILGIIYILKYMYILAFNR